VVHSGLHFNQSAPGFDYPHVKSRSRSGSGEFASGYPSDWLSSD
jgi:hypothetical protein